jgi:histidinol phosphatase-like PHP family hydrolase
MKNWERYRTYLETGDFHVHTSYTEGSNTVSELCEQAVRNGLRLICFAEHVRRELSYDYNDMLRDIQEARRLYPGLKILPGCEAKILDLSGSLDVSRDVLDRTEIVITCFHGFPQTPKEGLIKALFGALRHPRVDIWGHPATMFRLADFTPADYQKIVGECMKRRVLIENSLVPQYQAPQDFLDACRELGATMVTNSDAHDIYSLKRI